MTLLFCSSKVFMAFLGEAGLDQDILAPKKYVPSGYREISVWPTNLQTDAMLIL